jgi:hypothetical protein
MMTSVLATQFDIKHLWEVYNTQDNYEVLHLNPDDDRCLICFSSHGLYYPNTDDIFQEVVVQNNRFEWKKNIPSAVGKVIFVRDVTKQWYINGINREINTIEKLCDFLKELTQGYRVICVGSSAGGYAAALVGSLMGADYIFDFSGQFSLDSLLDHQSTRNENPMVAKYADDANYRKYYSILEIIQACRVPIFYFYPAKYHADICQSNFVESIPDVYHFRFNRKMHGQTCYLINFVDLLDLAIPELFALHAKFGDSIIAPSDFSLAVSGNLRTIKYWMYTLPRILVKRRIRKLMHRYIKG